jgi:hypothetical protein
MRRADEDPLLHHVEAAVAVDDRRVAGVELDAPRAAARVALWLVDPSYKIASGGLLATAPDLAALGRVPRRDRGFGARDQEFKEQAQN